MSLSCKHPISPCDSSFYCVDWLDYIKIIRCDDADFYSIDLPPVKPSAIALGTIFNHAASLAILAPVFGDVYHRSQAANSKEEFVKSRETASAAAAYGTSLVGSAVQAYGVGALINATGTLSYKGAAYLGSLIFMASSAPSVSVTFS